MLHYRVLRAVNSGFPFAILAIYVAAFILAMGLMFVFPPGTLLLLGLGLAGLAGVLVVGKTLGGLEHLAARLILRGGACPSCGQRMQTSRNESMPWQCEGCTKVFLPSGEEEDAQQRA